MRDFAFYKQLEPRLADLERDVRLTAVSAADGKDEFDVWYSDIKPRVAAVVGWHRRFNDLAESVEQTLRSPAAYDAAYQHLWDLLGAMMTTNNNGE